MIKIEWKENDYLHNYFLFYYVCMYVCYIAGIYNVTGTPQKNQTDYDNEVIHGLHYL